MSEVTITMSPTVGAIGAAMAKAQLEMKPAVKDSENPHFKSRFASLASCLEAIRPMHVHGIGVFQPTSNHGVDGVCVSTLLIHSSGEWIRGDFYMPAAKRDPQGFGSALSYARRYCLQSTVGLATDDDDGEAAQKSSQRNGSSGGQHRYPARGAAQSPSAPRAEAANDVDWLEWAMRHTIQMKQAASAGELKAAFSVAWIEAEKRGAPTHIRASLQKAKDDLKGCFSEAG